MSLKVFTEAEYASKKIILRVDFNLPFINNHINDDSRMKETLPTIKKLLQKKCKVVIISHRGRPDGKYDKSLSLKPIADYLGTLLNIKVKFIEGLITNEVIEEVKNDNTHSLIMLDNLRFNKEEEANSAKFAKLLSEMGDIYINDAFGCSHRAHASTEGICNYKDCYAGLLTEKEYENLEPFIHKLASPVTMIIGGGKIDTKIGLIESFSGKVDHFIIGGGIANTFVASQNRNIGGSLFEKDKLSTARKLEQLIKRNHKNLHLPIDYTVTASISDDAKTQNIAYNMSLTKDQKIADIGKGAGVYFAEHVRNSKTIIWNGPMGVYEYKPFRRGTKTIAQAIAYAVEKGAKAIVGGGDTVDALKVLRISPNKFTHVSTGGGAMLEFLVQGTLPGLKPLMK